MMIHADPRRAREIRQVLEVWLPLLVCMALGGTWYHVLRLRERAVLHARRICDQHGLPLLDDSVALHRVRARWHSGALHLTREYRFDTSLGGHDRQHASITLLGDRVVGASLPRREAPEYHTPNPAVRVLHDIPPIRASLDTGNKVIPITRARRTLH
jgi:hypothetical protein